MRISAIAAASVLAMAAMSAGAATYQPGTYTYKLTTPDH